MLSFSFAVLLFGFLVEYGLTASSSSATDESEFVQNLEKRDEAYQPSISHDFPHLLGHKRLLGWIDSSVDPCQDFYQYSCGKNN
jgi:hypothetical protein